MSRLRDAAALLVEHGKAIGRAEYARRAMALAARDAAGAERLGHAEAAKRIKALGNEVQADITAAEINAKQAAAAAEALMLALEHPGAHIARRLVATYHGARAAWRGTR